MCTSHSRSYRRRIDDFPKDPLQFLAAWDEAIHPKVDGEPILRTAALDPKGTPVTHVTVAGVPDEILTEYYEEEMYEELELSDLVAQHGGTLRRIISNPTSLAMTRTADGGYRVYELDAAGQRTGFDTRLRHPRQGSANECNGLRQPERHPYMDGSACEPVIANLRP